MSNYKIIVCLLLILITGCDKDTEYQNELACNFVDFMFYDDEPYNLGELSGNYIFLGFESTVSDESVKDLIESKDYFNKDYDFEINKLNNLNGYKCFSLKLNKTSSCGEIARIIDDIIENSMVAYANYTLESDQCFSVGVILANKCLKTCTNIFHVQLKNTNDLGVLQRIASKTKTQVLYESEYTEGWYTLSADKNSNGNAFQMANYFYETGLFEASEPSMMQLGGLE